MHNEHQLSILSFSIIFFFVLFLTFGQKQTDFCSNYIQFCATLFETPLFDNEIISGHSDSFSTFIVFEIFARQSVFFSTEKQKLWNTSTKINELCSPEHLLWMFLLVLQELLMMILIKLSDNCTNLHTWMKKAYCKVIFLKIPMHH